MIIGSKITFGVRQIIGIGVSGRVLLRFFVSWVSAVSIVQIAILRFAVRTRIFRIKIISAFRGMIIRHVRIVRNTSGRRIGSRSRIGGIKIIGN